MNDGRTTNPPAHSTEADLEAGLLDLGEALAWTSAPGLAAAVRLRVERLGPPPTPRLGWLSRLAATAGWPAGAPSTGRPVRRSLALAIVAALIVAGIAGAIGYGLPGLRIVILGPRPTTSASPVPAATAPVIPSAGADTTAAAGATQTAIASAPATPSPSPTTTAGPTSAPIESLGLGDRVGPAGVDDSAGYPVLLPTLRELGQPLGVYVRGAAPNARISAAYRATPTIPAGPLAPNASGTPVAILITEFPGRSDAGYMQKILPPDATIGSVRVAGNPGLWIAGAPHELLYVGPDGSIDKDSVRLVGNVLAWNDGQLTIRIEGAPDLATAQRIAASMR